MASSSVYYQQEVRSAARLSVQWEGERAGKAATDPVHSPQRKVEQSRITSGLGLDRKDVVVEKRPHLEDNSTNPYCEWSR